MATMYKSFLANDVASTKQLLHEAIPMTGSILSGTYGAFPNLLASAETNIKNYTHGIFESVYDYPYLSSSSNHVMDITCGFSSDSALSQSTVPFTGMAEPRQQDKKINIYNQMAQVLMGYDHTGSIQQFDADGNIYAGGEKIKEAFFISFSRLLVKDEIKKGSFTMKLGRTQAFANANNTLLTITDAGAQNDFRVNSPAGEYGILSASSGEGAGSTSGLCGLIFYQAGVCVLTASIFSTQPAGKIAATSYMAPPGWMGGTGNNTVTEVLTGSEISSSADFLRHRIYDISFNNTTELNSTIYFVRVNHNEFNYSSNPTYLSGSKIRVKNNSYDEPCSYISTVGLYSADNELMAICKMSEPLKKTPSNEMTIRCRLDF